MEKVRYFRSVNQLNIAMNVLSGNNFPLSDDETNSNFVSLTWVILGWLIKVAYFTSTLLGSLYCATLTPEEAFKRSGTIASVWVEYISPTIYLNLRRKDFQNLIRKYNDILIDSVDLKKIIRDTAEPYKRGYKWYSYACLTAAFLWSGSAIYKVPNNDHLTCEDFTVPAYLPGEPFGTVVFISGIFLQILGTVLINFGKISTDVYVCHFIVLLLAEYKFVRAQTAKALTISQANDPESDKSVIDALQTCVQHHTAVIEVSQELVEILAYHVGTKYIALVLEFCFLAYGIITFGSAIIEKISFVLYAAACIAQTYLICSCIQELCDESTSVTEDAFHENWHARSSVVKRIFNMMQINNQMECQLSAYGVVDLIVPTLAVILRKSYSVCLLLLKVN